jgi:3-methylfumaryl-CoA hydratase
MWAGGTLAFPGELRLGERARRTSTIQSVDEKSGRSGKLVFVTVRHRIETERGLAVDEEQHVVYREPSSGGAGEGPPPPAEAAWSEPFTADTVTLFRFSALTFNGHRIHYDIDFCRSEGHPGIVVHGPLLAQSLIAFAEAATGPLHTFAFRATAPLYHFETATLCRSGTALWVRGPDGRECMTAEAE